MSLIRIISLQLVILFSPVLQAASESITIGDKSVVLPNTNVLTIRKDKAVIKFAQETLTPGKQLLAVWVNNQQPEIEKVYFPLRYRYAISYTMSKFAYMEASTNDFRYVKMAVKDDLKNLRTQSTVSLPDGLDELRAKLMSINIDPETGVTTEGPANIELLTENDTQFSFLYFQPFKATLENIGQVEFTMLFCSNTLLINGRVVTVNVFSELKVAEDYTWIKKECASLSNSVVAIN